MRDAVVRPARPAGSASPRRLAAVALLGVLSPFAAVPAGGPAAPTELPAIAVARVQPAAVAYHWPLPGPPAVVRRFDPPARRWLPGHRGVDLAAAPGTLVTAAGDGVVHFAGPVAGRSVVSVNHADGLRTTYEPVTPLVTAGDRVRAGEPIGELVVGHAGCPVEPLESCLHWGVRQGLDYLDPLSLLGLGQVRLLPR